MCEEEEDSCVKAPIHVRKIKNEHCDIDFDLNIWHWRNIYEQNIRSKKYEQKSRIRKR